MSVECDLCETAVSFYCRRCETVSIYLILVYWSMFVWNLKSVMISYILVVGVIMTLVSVTSIQNRTALQIVMLLFAYFAFLSDTKRTKLLNVPDIPNCSNVQQWKKIDFNLLSFNWNQFSPTLLNNCRRWHGYIKGKQMTSQPEEKSGIR